MCPRSTANDAGPRRVFSAIPGWTSLDSELQKTLGGTRGKMKQAIQPSADVGQKAAAEPARSRRHAQPQSAEPGGHLVQLAVMMNSSPRGQALEQPKDDIQHSPRVQNLVNLSTEINQSAPA